MNEITPQLEALSIAEQKERTMLEATIEENQDAALAYVVAVRTIRDKRLYRSTHPTFDAYCRDALGKSGRSFNRNIQALSVQERLLDEGTRMSQCKKPETQEVMKSLPQNALLELAKQRQDKRLDKVMAAHAESSNGKVTAKSVQVAVAKLAHRSVPAPSRPTGFASIYGVPFVTPGAREQVETQCPAPVATPSGSGLTLDQLRFKLAQLRVPGTAAVLFGDATGETPIRRAGYDETLNHLVIE